MTETMTRPAARRSGGGLAGALAAEWTKLWGLRSTWVCLAATLLLGLATSVLGAESIQISGGADEVDAHTLASLAIMLPQFILIALASLAVTGEYATGAIRTTLTAVPRRGTALAAKAVVIGAVSLATGVLTGLLSLAATAWYFGDSLEVTAEGLLYGLLGPGLYLALLSLFVLGLGAVVRSTAGALTGAIGLLVGLPLIAQIVGNETLLRIVDHTPNPQGQLLTSGGDVPHSPQFAALLMAAWAVAGLAAGYAVLRGRDA
ncbi:ABC transporter permease subunit [Actinorugispora endophytica]|nr:ABC transporter permease subunit [Actinorugispora endophytica]